jgi:transcriptional regulator with PAS, ATPase and Fis domain
MAICVGLILMSMNNKFWREIFDQITSLVMIFRMQGEMAELMFVNKSVHTHLGYSPESFVMESEQDGNLRSSLSELVRAVSEGKQGVVLTDLAGREISFRIEMKTFYSDAIKEDLTILTLHPYVASQELESDTQPIVAESIVMKSVLERLRQLQEVGAGMAFVGGLGTGKRMLMDQTLRNVMDSGDSIWRLDYADAKKPVYSMDGVQVELLAMISVKLRKNTTVMIYDMDRMPKSDQVKMMGLIEGQESYLRFICGSGESPDVMVSAGSLLPELYYKLNVISIVLPALDLRRADIRPYADRWLERVCYSAGIQMPDISDKEWTRLFHHEFKGSFDELNTILKRSLLKWNGEKFQFELEQAEALKLKPRTRNVADAGSIVLENGSTYDDHMRDYLRQMMERCGWKIYGNDGAAARLGMKPTTLQSKLEKYGVARN